MTHRNVAGEIFAVLKLLDFCNENEVTALKVHHDYTGLQAWAEGTFKANTVLTKYYKSYVDQAGVSVEWVKTEGHSGDTWNEYADKLAKYAIGVLKEPPVLPETAPAAAAEPEEELDESIDIYALKHVDLRRLMAEKAEPAREPDPPEEMPQPVQPIPQMGAGEPEETCGGKDEAFARARSLAEEERYMEAWQLLKPFMNNTLSDGEIASFLSYMASSSRKQAEKACRKAESLLAMRPGARLIERAYCQALFNARIVPCLTESLLTEESYVEGRKACEKLLAVSVSSPTILDMVLPFLRISRRVGDRQFLARVGHAVDPAVLSDEPVKIGGRSFSRRQEFRELTG